MQNLLLQNIDEIEEVKDGKTYAGNITKYEVHVGTLERRLEEL